MINNKSRYEDLDIIDFLLLDYAADTPMNVLFYFDTMIAIFLNRPYHDLPDEALIKRIINLRNSGYIDFDYGDAPKLEYLEEELRSYLKLEPEVVPEEKYRMYRYTENKYNIFPEIVITENGKQLWEKIFSPNWKAIHHAYFDPYGSKNFVLEAITEDRVNELLRYYYEKYPVDSTYDVQYSQITDWKVSSWKIIPNACRLTYTVKGNLEPKYDNDWYRMLYDHYPHCHFKREWRYSRYLNVYGLWESKLAGLKEVDEAILESRTSDNTSGLHQLIVYLIELKNIVHFDADKQSANHVIYNALLRAINQMPGNPPLVKALKKSLTIDNAVIPIDVSSVSEIQEVIDLLNHAFEKSDSEPGVEQGFQRGFQRGFQQGEHNGQVQQLLRQIQLKFGDVIPSYVFPSYKNILQHANNQTLLIWSERILTANTIEQLFGLEH